MKEIDLSQVELNNFLELINVFGDNLSILSVTKINNFAWDWIPSFRCAIISIDNNNNKIYFNIKKKILYRLSDKKKIENINYQAKFYMIIFTKSKMIAQNEI